MNFNTSGVLGIWKRDTYEGNGAKYVEKADSAVVVDISSVAGGGVRSPAFERGVVLSSHCSIKACPFPSAPGKDMCRHHEEFYCMEARELLDENVFRFFIEESFSHVSQSQVALSNAIVERHLSIRGKGSRWEYGWRTNARRKIFVPRVTGINLWHLTRNLRSRASLQAKAQRAAKARLNKDLSAFEKELLKERSREYYVRVHASAKWTPLAERLAALNVGEDFFVPNENPKDFARVARMGLGANSASKYIPKSIITRPDGVLIRRGDGFGHWSLDRWGSYAEVKRKLAHSAPNTEEMGSVFNQERNLP